MQVVLGTPWIDLNGVLSNGAMSFKNYLEELNDERFLVKVACISDVIHEILSSNEKTKSHCQKVGTKLNRLQAKWIESEHIVDESEKHQ